MKRRYALLLACVIGWLASSQPVAAHSRPAKHTAVVQVEDQAVLLYVAWTPPTGLVTPLMLARASILVPGDIREGLGRLMSRAALRAIEVRIDGVAISFDRVQQRLVTDGDGRYTIGVLAETRLAASKKISVRAKDAKIQLAWSNFRQRGTAESPIPPSTWTRSALDIALAPAR